MNELNKIIENIFNNNITLLVGKALSGRTTITTEILYKYGINDNKNILLYSLNNDDTFFVTKLISKMTGIPKRDISCYYHPCSRFINKDVSTDKDKIFETIDKIIKSNIVINSFVCNVSEDIDYICEYLEYDKLDLIIIDNLKELIKKSKYSLEEILIKLNNLSLKYKLHIVLWGNIPLDKKVILKNIMHYDIIKKYTDNIILVERHYEYKKYDKLQIKNNNKEVIVNYDMNTDTAMI